MTDTSAQRRPERSFSTFFVIWFGQLISTFGSSLTGFAFSVWLYETTQSTTLFALNMLAAMLPNILLAPMIGALVDRWNRRYIMIMADTVAGLATALLAALLLADSLQVWHVYVATFITSAFTAFQWPAYSAVTTLLVPKEHLGRAGGMVQFGQALSQLIAPALAGVLYVTVGLGNIMLIDVGTFLIAVLSLAVIRVPQPTRSKAGEEAKGSLWQEGLFGIRYILEPARRGLLGLLLYFAGWNLFWSIANTALIPMVLEIAAPDVVGSLSSVIGIGMLIGTIAMSAWGGPKQRVLGILGFGLLGALSVIVVGLTPNLLVIVAGMFVFMLLMPIFGGLSQALWQSKVEPDLQGRVFTARRMVAWSTTPLAYLLAGPLADNVFEPLMAEGGALAPLLGPVFGVGAGRGVGVLISLMGVCILLLSVGGYSYQPLRTVEETLPDVTPDDTESDRSEQTAPDGESVLADAPASA